MFIVNVEPITLMKVIRSVYQGKSHIIAKEECLSFIQKQLEIQLYKLYAGYAHEFDVKNWISYCAKRNKIHGAENKEIFKRNIGWKVEELQQVIFDVIRQNESEEAQIKF